MQAKTNESFQWITGVLLVAILVFSAVGYFSEPEQVVIPTAAEIAALVVVNSTDNSAVLQEILEQVDTRTDVSKKDKNNAIDYAEDELSNRDFKELIEDLIIIDEEDFTIVSKSVKDTEVTAASEDDNEDGNLRVEQFIRVVYHDKDADADDNEVIYVVLTAEITDLYDDSNDKEVEYSIEEVSRSFEF